MKQCNTEGCSYPVFSKGKCKFHMERKPLKKGKFIAKKRTSPSPNRMREFFLSIWSIRPHRSEISGLPLYGEPLSTYFHHIVEKSNPLYGRMGIFDAENIIIITAEEHEIIHNDMYRYEEVNKRREKLLEKYEENRRKIIV